MTLTRQPERVPSGASDMAPSQSSAGRTEKVSCNPEMRQPDPPYVNRHSSSLADWDSALEKIPAHRKLVLVRIPEEANTNSLLFTPGCEDGAVALADVFIEGGLSLYWSRIVRKF